jgi:hypothetical protein
MAFESAVPKHLHDGSLVLKDGAGTPNTLTVPHCLGNYKLTGLKPNQRNVNKYEARQNLVGTRLAGPAYPSLSFDWIFTGLDDDTLETVYDFIMKRGLFSTNTSTTESTGDAYTIDVEWTVDGTSLPDPDAADHVLTAEDWAPEVEVSEGEPNTFSASGEVLGTVSET